ncbi:MAG: hypothetical protein Q8Q00_14210 [Dehalococcoidia bacterium]|nr:hypothetical protein [Dehalococcoidia bacterium]
MNADALLDSLLAAQSEIDVTHIVGINPVLAADANWRQYGGPNYAGIFFNQQSNPVSALADKIVNCIDARLMLECLTRGIDPQGTAAPATMGDAVELFFGVKVAEYVELSDRKRRELAEGIVLAADGSRERPNLLLIDQGEGQLSEDFPKTFLSLMAGNKQRIPFVQGQFNMGGTGVLPYAGEKGYQLIVSRRAPKLSQANRGWGFTLVRHHPAHSGDKSSYWEYCVDELGCIFETSPHPLPVLPDGPLQFGTIVKLWAYDLPPGIKTNITLDLWRELNRKLWAPALPLTLWEKRDYGGHSPTKLLLGNEVRVQVDDREKLEPTTPLTIRATLGSLGMRRIDVSVFKVGYRKSEYASQDEAIIYTVNGQAHAALGRSFLRAPTRANLGYLADYMLVHIDCTDVPVAVRERIFPASRDRMYEGSQRKEIEEALAEALARHEGLRRLDDARRIQLLANKTSDERVMQVIGRLLAGNKELREFLIAGGRFVSSEEPGDVAIAKFLGRYVPTFLRFRGQRPDEGWTKQVAEKSFARLTIETDAQDDYLDRRTDSGSLSYVPGLVKNYHLFSGKLVVKVALPPGARPGDRIPLSITMSRPSDTRLTVDVTLEVVKTNGVGGEGGGNGHKLPQPHGADVGAPKLWLVYRDQKDGCKTWAEMEPRWTNEDVCDVRGQTRDVFVNMDAAILHSFLRRYRRLPSATQDRIHETWKLGLYFCALALFNDLARYDESEEIFKNAVGALAKVILEAFYSQLLIDPIPAAVGDYPSDAGSLPRP